ncbi:MAG: hypothetical protein Q4P08_01515, partial [Eubacteriales bacterium]|nr:hypothetical protein [Eubacteriales bacterium]
MDYWEGILLGPVWTDSDVRPRHKRSLLYLLSLIWLAAGAFLLVFPNFAKYLPLGALSSGLLAGLLFFLMPVAGAYYYRIKSYFRPLILLGYAAAYLLLMNTGLKLLLAKLEIDFYTLPEKFLEFVNLRIEEVSRYLQSLEGIEGTIISIVLG